VTIVDAGVSRAYVRARGKKEDGRIASIRGNQERGLTSRMSECGIKKRKDLCGAFMGRFGRYPNAN